MTQPPVPMLDLQGEVDALWPDLMVALERVLKSAQFIQGPEVGAFEEEFAGYLGVARSSVVAVNSGTDALVIALQALGVGPGDEVITTPFTFVATASAILRVGASPVFADIDPVTYNLDPTAVARLVGPSTRAILPVHLYGLPADLGRLCTIAHDHDLLVVEDAAQALSATWNGRKIGTIGDAAAFSFFPSKNLGAYGDAGLVLVRDPPAAERATMLRAHGSRKKYFNEILGYNSRLDSIQAAILRLKLTRLDEATRLRRLAAARYDERLGAVPGVEVPTAPSGCEHAYHQYTIRVPASRRARVQARLTEAGSGTMVYYPVVLPDLPLFQGARGEVSEARAAAASVLSLPIWPGMPEQTQDRVVAALTRAL